MKLITRLAAGAAIAGALCGLAGAPGAAAASDDVHVNYLAGPYGNRQDCENVRAIVNITHRADEPCFSAGGVWYFYWYDNR